MVLITKIRRFFTWYVFTGFRTVFKGENHWQIHLRGYIVHFRTDTKELIIAKRDNLCHSGAFIGYKTIYIGSKR